MDEGGEPPLAQQIQGPAEGDPSASGNRGRKNGEPDLVIQSNNRRKNLMFIYLNQFGTFVGGKVRPVRNKKTCKDHRVGWSKR